MSGYMPDTISVRKNENDILEITDEGDPIGFEYIKVDFPFFIRFIDYHDGEDFTEKLNSTNAFPQVEGVELEGLTDSGEYLFAFFAKDDIIPSNQSLWQIAKANGFHPMEDI